MVCKLQKALYSLMQSSQFQYKKFAIFFFKNLGLKQINIDYKIFDTKTNSDKPIASTFVNKIKVIIPKASRIMEIIKTKLIFTFLMINIRSINFYLGLTAKHNQEKQTIKLCHLVYINKILAKFYFDKAQIINIQIIEIAIFKQKTKKKALIFEKKRY